MENFWHAKALLDIRQELATDFENGLSAGEVARRIRKSGYNDLPRGKKLHWWQFFLRQFYNPLVLILLIAAVLTFWLEEPIDTFVILLSVLVNVAIGFFQEYRSNRVFEKLKAIVMVDALVRRGGKIFQIPARELTVGDIITVKSGARIPADARIISEISLETNEALLTGESSSVAKNMDACPQGAALAERKNMIYTGTVVERGEATAVVVAIGAATEIGQIARLTQGISNEVTPLQERLSRLSHIIVWLVAASAALILFVGIQQDRPLLELFTIAVAVAVAAIPEGLPAALSVVLAVAAQKIFARNGLVKTLIGAETLGSTSIICSDKTGTLTEGVMRLEELVAVSDPMRAELALAFANEATITEGIHGAEVRGEATDRAKLEYVLREGGNFTDMLKRYPRKALMPFSDDEKYIASFHDADGGSIALFVTGAPELLLFHSTKSPSEREEILRLIEERAALGLRVIGIAAKTFRMTDGISVHDKNALAACVCDLEFLGLATLGDPIRKDVPVSIAEVRNAGIRVIMITGDHHLTALSIGKELGFSTNTGAVIDGPEIERLTDAELSLRIQKIEIIARASPKHKIRIVDLLKAGGAVVAMTGDGVNDAPALKAADIGVALGAGSDVTKEASDLVLLDNSFTVISSAVREGRAAFDNIRKVTVFLLSNSFTELIIILASLLLKVPLPITAVQILWANLVEDGLPNFALAFEPSDKDVMRRRPFARREPILDREGLVIVFVVGLFRDLLLVGVFLALYFYSGFVIEYIRTMIFVLLATDSLIYVFSIKSLKTSIIHAHFFDNPYLLIAVVLGLTAMFAAIYTAPLQQLLGTMPLQTPHLAFVMALGFMNIVYVEMAKWWFRRDSVAIASV